MIYTLLYLPTNKLDLHYDRFPIITEVRCVKINPYFCLAYDQTHYSRFFNAMRSDALMIGTASIFNANHLQSQGKCHVF